MKTTNWEDQNIQLKQKKDDVFVKNNNIEYKTFMKQSEFKPHQASLITLYDIYIQKESVI